MDISTEALFVIMLDNVPGVMTTESVIRAHVAYLRELDRDGELVMCGPFTDYRGGMVVIRAKDRAHAERQARRDPFVTEGVRTYEIRSWLLSTEANNHLGMG